MIDIVSLAFCLHDPHWNSWVFEETCIEVEYDTVVGHEVIIQIFLNLSTPALRGPNTPKANQELTGQPLRLISVRA